MLANRKLIWGKYIRVYTDNRNPIFRKIPHFQCKQYSNHWKLYGFVITWLGRQFFFSFGEDVNGFYKEIR